MTEAEERKMKAQVAKGIARCVSDGKWSWRATHFESRTYYGMQGISVFVDFEATFHYVKARVRGESHGLPNEEETFMGDNSLNDAILWAADKYWEMHKIVKARLAPYIQGQENYMRAWEGRL